MVRYGPTGEGERMRDRTFERIGACSGLVFVVLAALSGFIYPQQPR